jgi:hypothetical protein
MVPPVTALRAAALAYAAAGIPVLPLHTPGPDGRCSCRRPGCERPGKHPRWHPRLITAGLHQASTDPAVLDAWWSVWPEANIGLRTGVTVDVCDVDSDAGLRAVLELLGDPRPELPAVRTGSGGWHLYVGPTGFGNRVALLAGVDWRGAGGYVVAPPSRHASGRPYTWIRRLRGPPPPCPGRLRRLLAPPPPPVRPPAGPVHEPGRYAAAALRYEIERVREAPVGTRNNTLYRAARSLGRLAGADLIGDGEIYRALSPAARAAGLPAVEVARTIASGLAAGRRHPRAAA